MAQIEAKLDVNKGEEIITSKDGSKVDLYDLLEEIGKGLDSLAIQLGRGSILDKIGTLEIREKYRALETYKVGLLVGAGLMKPALVTENDGVYLSQSRVDKVLEG